MYECEKHMLRKIQRPMPDTWQALFWALGHSRGKGKENLYLYFSGRTWAVSLQTENVVPDGVQSPGHVGKAPRSGSEVVIFYIISFTQPQSRVDISGIFVLKMASMWRSRDRPSHSPCVSTCSSLASFATRGDQWFRGFLKKYKT